MKYFSCILFIFIVPFGQLSAQKSETLTSFGLHTKSFVVSRPDTVYSLSEEFIMQGSESVVLDSIRALKNSVDYTMDYRRGTLVLLPGCVGPLLSDSLRHEIRIVYRNLPIDIKSHYALRHIEIRKDSVGNKKAVITPSSPRLFSDDFFGSGLQKSGSIVRGFSVGSNRDLTLNSGFRMQLAGKLAQDVDVTAALTDENSPIQPEGTTQTLREVDKVYVEIKHPIYSAILGDFNLQIDQKEGGEFGQLNRKLQGAKGTATFDQIGSSDIGSTLSLTGATARGKYATNQFLGKEGVQGPYRLTGPNGENHLVIVAGSERVYFNGEQLTRGEVNDYIIDYSSGEITFSSRRLITNASRIVVDFEYSDQQFVRNLVAGSVSSHAFGNGVKLNVSFAQEADDPDSPIDYTFTDSTREILRQSGADRLKASISGIVKTDSGKGQYLLEKDTINGKEYSILRYAPGDTAAVYVVTFSPVAQVPADSPGYDRIAASEYRFAGIGQGGYLPIRLLPMPQLHQLIDVSSQVALGSDFNISGEYAASRFDQNRFSTVPGSSLKGGAFKFAVGYSPRQFHIGGVNIGDFEFHVSERYVEKQFLALDRENEVEFNRKWNLTDAAGSNEEIQEFSFNYKPIKSIATGITYGVLDRTGEIHTARTQVNFGLSDSSLPNVQYQIEHLATSDAQAQNESRWVRQRGTAEYEIARWHPGFRIETEERIANPLGSDSVQQGSFRYVELAPRVTSAEFLKMTISGELQIRSEDSADVGSLSRASNSLTQLYTWRFDDRQVFSSSFSLSLRSVEYTDEFKRRGNLNSDAYLIRSQSRVTPWKHFIETDVYYEFSNQRSARLERLFIKVTPGNGNYRYLGDVNNNGIVDENDFELTRFDGDYIVVYLPSEQLYPVADLKGSVRLRLQPSRLILNSTTWLEKVVQSVSTETYVRVDERNKEADTKQIYLLNFSHFLNEQNTIAGTQQITQDVFLFENNPDLSFRFRFNQRSGLTQFVSSIERNFLKERSVRIRSQLVEEIGNQTEFTNKIDRTTASSMTLRDRDLASNSIQSDFSYRPSTNWEVGFTLGVTETVNHLGGGNATADINEEGLRMVQSFPGIGQIRAELRREEVNLANIADPSASLPYEFTAGKAIGKTYIWQLNFDYRITANLQLTLNYNGRSEGGRTPIHFAKMEARAFF